MIQSNSYFKCCITIVCFNYGGTDSTLVKNYGLTKQRAKEIYDNYMSGFLGLRDYQAFRRKDVLEKGYILINPITRHKTFIHDWDNLCKINEYLNSEEGRYLLANKDKKTLELSSFLRRRLSDIQKNSINYPRREWGFIQ